MLEDKELMAMVKGNNLYNTHKTLDSAHWECYVRMPKGWSTLIIDIHGNAKPLQNHAWLHTKDFYCSWYPNTLAHELHFYTRK